MKTHVGEVENMSKPPLRVLMADGITDRADSFAITGKDWVLTKVPNTFQMEEELAQKTWDIVFVSTYLGNWDNSLTSIPPLVSAFKRGVLKVVVLFSPVASDALKQLEALKREGVPAFYYPYDYSFPCKHEEFGAKEQKDA